MSAGCQAGLAGGPSEFGPGVARYSAQQFPRFTRRRNRASYAQPRTVVQNGPISTFYRQPILYHDPYTRQNS